MKILFIGCVESSKSFLKTLVDKKYEVCGVITKSASSFNADYCDLSDICKNNSIPYLYVNNVNDQNSVEFIKEKHPDVIYCFGWSQLIRQEVLSIPPMGIIGFHPAKLPANRGRHPIIWSLVLGLKETASSFFFMNEGADSGNIISQRTVPISINDDAASLYAKIVETANEQIVAFTDQLIQGSLTIRENDISQGNCWRKRDSHDGEIDWRMSSRAIYNLVRALAKPYPGAQLRYKEKLYHVWKVEEVVDMDVDNIEYGKVLKVNSETEFYIKSYDNVIHVLNCDPIYLTEGEYL